MCNWGPLSEKDGKFYTYAETVLPAEDVCELAEPFRGYKYYQKYTTAQIESVKQLLLYWNQLYKVPIKYNEDIWQVTSRALSGEAGVFTHCSVRADKTDVFPQPELIQMLKTL